MNALETAWDRVAALSPNPPVWVVQLAALIAVIIVLEPHLWRIARNVVTIAHEGAHLIVAVLVGRRLKGLRLHSDTSGVAISSGKPTGFGVILMTFAGVRRTVDSRTRRGRVVGRAARGLGAVDRRIRHRGDDGPDPKPLRSLLTCRGGSRVVRTRLVGGPRSSKWPQRTS